MRVVASKQHSVNACHVSKIVFKKGRVAKKKHVVERSSVV